MNLTRVLQVVVSVAILAVLCRLVDVPRLIHAIAAAHPAFIAAAFGVVLVGVAIRAYRWMFIINKDRHRAGFFDSVLVTMVGGALNIVLPANTGEVAKSFYAYQRLGLRERAVSGSVVDKLIALLAAGLLGIPPGLAYRLWDLALFNGLLVVGVGAMVYCPRLLPWKHITGLLRRVHVQADLSEFQAGSTLTARQHLGVLALSLWAWATTFLAVYLLFASIGAEGVTVEKVFMVGPLIAAAKLFPFTVDGLGTAEAASVYFFGRTGVAPEAALAVQLMGRVLGSYLLGLIGVMIMLFARPRKRESAPTAREESAE